MSRRLPVYFLVDTSGSMRGEPIAAVNVGLRDIISSQRQDAYALETVHVSVLTFGADVRVLAPLTPLDQFDLPEIAAEESCPTLLGKALETLLERMDKEVRRNAADVKGDWPPILFLMTDGSPTDVRTFERQLPEIRKRRFGAIVGCAAGTKARRDFLDVLTDKVFALSTMDSTSLTGFFRWVSESVSTGGVSPSEATATLLPRPPANIDVPT
jgi:uncharacterized protein YegL